MNPESNTLDVDFTRTQCTLAATWRTSGTSGKAPERYEWSVGEDGQSMGGVLLDVLNEPLWRETGQRNVAIYTTSSSKNAGIFSLYSWSVQARDKLNANIFFSADIHNN